METKRFKFGVHRATIGAAIPLALLVGDISARRSLMDGVISALVAFLLIVAFMEGLRYLGVWK